MPLSRSHRLPAAFFLVEPARTADPEAVIARLPPGTGVIYRDYGAPDRHIRARRLAALCRRRRLVFLVAGDWRLALQVRAHGLHVPEYQLPSARWRRAAADWRVTTAAHGPAALALARRRGADAVLLAPVFPTKSHVDALTLGPHRFARLSRLAGLPVYALGGVTSATRRRIPSRAAAGVAAIEGFERGGLSRF